MNLLFLNNYHYLRGGSEQVFFEEMRLLKKRGDDVHSFARRSPADLPSRFASYFPGDMKTDSLSINLKAFRTFKELIYSYESKKQLNLLLKTYQPDVAHAHNIYGRLTTSVLDTLNKKNIPVVMTLHDYKLICPSYLLRCKNTVCEDCRGKHFYHAILNRCHKGSLIASSVYAFESWFNRVFQKYRSNVCLYIAPSQFLKKKMEAFGWPGEQIVHIPNYITSTYYTPKYDSKNYLLFIGRLSPEKGIETLIRAFQKIDHSIRLLIVGDGPERHYFKQLSKDDKRIEFIGYLSGKPLRDITRNSRAVVLPSTCYENAPMSILEAFASGKPVIGANIGGIPEMINNGENGFLFESGNDDDLSEKLEKLLACSGSQIAAMGKAAREKAETVYNSTRHYEALHQVYQKAMASKGSQ